MYYARIHVMETLSKNLWKQISTVFPADEDNSKTANALFCRYEEAGHLSQNDISLYDISIIADFFRRIALLRSTESPILRRRDTRWMSELDYTRVNVRGTGSNEKSGTFLSAAFFLAAVRTKAIIIAPITQGPSDNLEILSSHVRIRPDLAEPGLIEAGFSVDMQARAFCEAAHLLGFVIGWETDYRVDKLAPVVLKRPELFLWKEHGKFASDIAEQSRLRLCVRQEMSRLKQAGLSDNRTACGDALNTAGLDALPVRDGSGRTALSFRLHEKGKTETGPIEYWSRTFDVWRDEFRFDFLVLKGLNNADAPDLSIAGKAADTARKGGIRRCVGVAAEGNPLDIEQFGIYGMDIVLAGDALASADEDWFRKVFELDTVLKRINLGRKLKFSVALEVNPGETGTPEEQSRALIKRFVARFLGIRDSRRPLLETMGALDGAWGFENSIRNKTNIVQPEHREYSLKAHRLEDAASLYSKMLTGGELLTYGLNDRVAWWIIRAKKGMLIAVVSVENENRLPPGHLDLIPSDYWPKAENMTTIEYDFAMDEEILHLGNIGVIDSDSIPYGEFRLYAVA